MSTATLEKEAIKSTNGKKAQPQPQIELSSRIKALNIVQDFIDHGIDELAKTVPWTITPKRIKSDEVVTVAGLELAKVQGIPLNVTLVIEQISDRISAALKDMPQDGLAWHYFNRGSIAGIVTVMLKYYHNPDWSLNDTVETLNEAQITQLWKFLENQRWGKAILENDDEPEPEGKE